jgi:hypothetical protein
MRMEVLLADFAERASVVMLPLLLGAGLALVIVAGVAAVRPSESQSVRRTHPVLAVVLGVSSIWLAVYAAGEDTYHGGGVSRWEHAGRGGGTFPVGAAIVVAGITSLGLAASAVARSGRLMQVLVASATAVSCFLLLFAWVLLTAGH